MPLMALVLLAPVLPLQFPLLNLSTRNRHNLCCQELETLKRRFLFLWLITLHESENTILQAGSQCVHDGSSDSDNAQISEQQRLPIIRSTVRWIKNEMMFDPSPCHRVAVSDCTLKEPRREKPCGNKRGNTKVQRNFLSQIHSSKLRTVFYSKLFDVINCRRFINLFRSDGSEIFMEGAN